MTPLLTWCLMIDYLKNSIELRCIELFSGSFVHWNRKKNKELIITGCKMRLLNGRINWFGLLIAIIYLCGSTTASTERLVRLRRKVETKQFVAPQSNARSRVRHFSPKALVGSPYDTKAQEAFMTSTSVKYGRHKTPSIRVAHSNSRWIGFKLHLSLNDCEFIQVIKNRRIRDSGYILCICYDIDRSLVGSLFISAEESPQLE